ncbi:tonb [Anaeramoeba flamelloides]|uniref:Tonb n=1 Tax=Anaeramoeba flamelloides TaxID=1746091 RepID=A0AAV7Y7D3_9EUKA|nr:tonb [Anaeramoeba flamelloides]KAJ6229515.1 tonb [Anaeramoeba flamelloides]
MGGTISTETNMSLLSQNMFNYQDLLQCEFSELIQFNPTSPSKSQNDNNCNKSNKINQKTNNKKKKVEDNTLKQGQQQQQQTEQKEQKDQKQEQPKPQPQQKPQSQQDFKTPIKSFLDHNPKEQDSTTKNLIQELLSTNQKSDDFYTDIEDGSEYNSYYESFEYSEFSDFSLEL